MRYTIDIAPEHLQELQALAAHAGTPLNETICMILRMGVASAYAARAQRRKSALNAPRRALETLAAPTRKRAKK